MLDNIYNVLSIFGAHYQNIIVCGLIMVSAIIVAIGLLKPVLFDKIESKCIRKAALSFSSVALCFLVMFVVFLTKHFNFQYYLVASFGLSVCCIVTYWFYENTCLRNLIATIGGIVLKKMLKVSLFALTTEDVEAVKTELKKTGEELKVHTKQELKKTATKVKEDNDLKTL